MQHDTPHNRTLHTRVSQNIAGSVLRNGQTATDPEINELQQEIERLRAALKARPTDAPPNVSQLRATINRLRTENGKLKDRQLQAYIDDRIRGLLKGLDQLTARLPSSDLTGQMLLRNVHAELRSFLEARQRAYRKVERSLARLEQHLPTKEAERLRKVQALAEQGGTDGERTAAAAALKRLQRQ